jgi:WD40 repeat protein
VAIGPSRQWLIASVGGDHLEVLDTTTGQKLGRLECQEQLASLTVSPDGQRLAGMDSGHQLLVWDLNEGKRLATIPGVPTYNTYLMWLGPNQLAVVSSSSLYLIDPATESIAAELEPKVVYPWKGTEHDGRIW